MFPTWTKCLALGGVVHHATAESTAGSLVLWTYNPCTVHSQSPERTVLKHHWVHLQILPPVFENVGSDASHAPISLKDASGEQVPFVATHTSTNQALGNFWCWAWAQDAATETAWDHDNPTSPCVFCRTTEPPESGTYGSQDGPFFPSEAKEGHARQGSSGASVETPHYIHLSPAGSAVLFSWQAFLAAGPVTTDAVDLGGTRIIGLQRPTRSTENLAYPCFAIHPNSQDNIKKCPAPDTPFKPAQGYVIWLGKSVECRVSQGLPSLFGNDVDSGPDFTTMADTRFICCTTRETTAAWTNGPRTLPSGLGITATEADDIGDGESLAVFHYAACSILPQNELAPRGTCSAFALRPGNGQAILEDVPEMTLFNGNIQINYGYICFDSIGRCEFDRRVLPDVRACEENTVWNTDECFSQPVILFAHEKLSAGFSCRFLCPWPKGTPTLAAGLCEGNNPHSACLPRALSVQCSNDMLLQPQLFCPDGGYPYKYAIATIDLSTVLGTTAIPESTDAPLVLPLGSGYNVPSTASDHRNDQFVARVRATCDSAFCLPEIHCRCFGRYRAGDDRCAHHPACSRHGTLHESEDPNTRPVCQCDPYFVTATCAESVNPMLPTVDHCVSSSLEGSTVQRTYQSPDWNAAFGLGT
jgi:hypothetical protein